MTEHGADRAWFCSKLRSGCKSELQQTAFLPGALEVQERPPSPVGRWLMYILLAFFSIGIGWACVGEVDIVVTAPGRIVPSGQVKIVQAPEAGTVKAIHVAEGEQVAAGQLLVTLDPTYAEADHNRLSAQRTDALITVEWRRALDAWFVQGRGEAAALFLSVTMDTAQYSLAEKVFRQHREETMSRLFGFDQDLAANRSEQAMVQAEQALATASLAVLIERVVAYKTLVERQYGARVQYLELLQQQTELERTLPVLASREQQLQEVAAAIAARKDATEGELRKNNLLELARVEAGLQTLEQELLKAKQRQRLLSIHAPVAGSVQQLALHTVGGVVTPAQEIMKLVPHEAYLEVEAMVQNKDVGFLIEGQQAAVKIDTYNFTKYGLVEATIMDISNDAVNDEQHGWVFKMRLHMEEGSLMVEGKQLPLSPGMAITAEVKTGKRRLLEFFLSPLLRYRQESVRER